MLQFTELIQRWLPIAFEGRTEADSVLDCPEPAEEECWVLEEKLVAFVDERDCVLVRIWDLARPADPFAAELAPERPELVLVALQ